MTSSRKLANAGIVLDVFVLDLGRKFGGEVIHLHDHSANARDQKIVAEHRRDGDAERGHGGDERARNARRHRCQIRRTGDGDIGERVHHAPNRPEQTEPTVPLLSPIELQYTNKDIDRLEQEGRANRTNPNRIPEYSSLSQILRCVGAYLVQKRARLIKLWRDSDSVSLEYQTSLGNMLKDTLVVGELYDLWVRMYMQRAERSTTL